MKLLRSLIAALTFACAALSIAPGVAAASSSTSALTLEPSSGGYATGATVRVAVHLATGGNAINAVQANFSYPTAQLEFISIDTAGTAFDVGAPSTGGNGSVKIARGSLKAVNGNVLVASIVFRTLSAGTAKIEGASGSAAPRDGDAHDTLGTTSGATFTISGPTVKATRPTSSTAGGSSVVATGAKGSAAVASASKSPAPHSLAAGWSSAPMYLIGLMILILLVVGWLLWRRSHHLSGPPPTPLT
jgi:hypothetical protein